MMVSIATRGRVAPACERRSYSSSNVSPAAREDAWDLCRVAVQCGGVEVHDCCFTFANEERWLAASEALRFRFGPEYFEVIDSGEST